MQQKDQTAGSRPQSGAGPVVDRSVRCGFVGLGDQGLPMAEQMLAAGYPLALWARRPESLAPFEGAAVKIATSLKALGQMAEHIGVCVTDDDQTRLVCEELFESMPKGGRIAIHSTVNPDTVRKLDQQATAHGLILIDAPVSGGNPGAKAGTLTVPTGGDEAAAEAARPIFETFGGSIVYMGAAGNGQCAKLVNNSLMASNLTVLHNALGLATALGLDRALMLRVLSLSSGGSLALSIYSKLTPEEASARGPKLLRRYFGVMDSLLGKDQENVAALQEATKGLFEVSAYTGDKHGPPDGVDPPSAKGDVDRSVRCGFVGLGDQGQPIAQHMIDAGYPMTLCDLRPEMLEPFVGGPATIASSLEELGSQVDHVGVCVTDNAAVRVVCEGLFEVMKPGARIAIHSTVNPNLVSELAQRAAERGLIVIDAPVSGGRNGGEAATLTVLTGGDEAVAEAARPIFETFGRLIVYMGAAGMAQRAKLVNNSLLASNMMFLNNAFGLAGALGIDRETMTQVLNSSSGHSRAFIRFNLLPYAVASTKGPELVERYLGVMGELVGDDQENVAALRQALKPFLSIAEAGRRLTSGR